MFYMFSLADSFVLAQSVAHGLPTAALAVGDGLVDGGRECPQSYVECGSRCAKKLNSMNSY